MTRIKQFFLLVFACSVVIVLLLYTYGGIRSMLVDEVNTRMNEYAVNESLFVKYIFEREMTSLRSSARFIADKPSYTREQAVSVLQNLKETTHFVTVVLARLDGYSITDDNQVTNISNRDYFKSAIQGSETISERFGFFDSKTQGVVLAVPIYRNKMIIGILIGAHTRDSFTEVLSSQVFGGNAYCLVFDDAGEIVLFTPSPYRLSNVDNIFNFYQTVRFAEGETLEHLRKAIALGESGSFRFSVGNQTRLVTYRPLGINRWIIMSVVPPDIAFKINRYIFFLVTMQVVLLLVIFLVVLLYYLLTFRRKNKLLSLLAESQEIINHAIPGGVIKTTLTDGFSILYKSSGFFELTGFSEYEIHEQFANVFMNFVHPDDRDQFVQDFTRQISGGSYVLQYRFFTRKGHIWVYDSGRIITDLDNSRVLVRVLIDMTRVKISLDVLKNKAEHDSATQLYNKAATRKYVEAILSESSLVKDLHAFVLMDIDRFKHINDTYGHIVGDEVIVRISDVLKNSFRKTDLIGRVGGDEFMVLIGHMPDRVFAEEQLTRLCTGICGIKLADGYGISCSVGAALVPLHGTDYDELYKNADAALYEAKHQGKNRFVIFSDDKKQPPSLSS